MSSGFKIFCIEVIFSIKFFVAEKAKTLVPSTSRGGSQKKGSGPSDPQMRICPTYGCSVNRVSTVY